MVLRFAAQLAVFKELENIAKAKAEGSVARKEKALARKQEIERLQREAIKITEAKMSGKLLGAYDSFLERLKIDEDAFEKINNELFGTALKMKAPPPTVVAAVNNINNIQSLVKRKPLPK